MTAALSLWAHQEHGVGPNALGAAVKSLRVVGTVEERLRPAGGWTRFPEYRIARRGT